MRTARRKRSARCVAQPRRAAHEGHRAHAYNRPRTFRTLVDPSVDSTDELARKPSSQADQDGGDGQSSQLMQTYRQHSVSSQGTGSPCLVLGLGGFQFANPPVVTVTHPLEAVDDRGQPPSLPMPGRPADDYSRIEKHGLLEPLGEPQQPIARSSAGARLIRDPKWTRRVASPCPAPDGRSPGPLCRGAVAATAEPLHLHGAYGWVVRPVAIRIGARVLLQARSRSLLPGLEHQPRLFANRQQRPATSVLMRHCGYRQN